MDKYIIYESLSPREQEIYYTIVEEGIFTPCEISKKLCISNSTVSAHLQKIFLKTSVNSKEALIYDYWTKKEKAICAYYNKIKEICCQKIKEIENKEE